MRSVKDPSSRIPRLSSIAIGAMFLSGFAHTFLYILWSQDWNSPVSFRKPILFGFSTGLTLWSCVYVLQCLKPKKADRLLSWLLSGSLLVEVGLITLQAWRVTPSHFNDQGFFNTFVEHVMLGLIVCATAIITWITLRSLSHSAFLIEHQTSDEQAFRLAIRAGMLFLLLSCIAGFLITLVGKQNQAQGLSPELYLGRGVLKFPHGAALHAIQALVIVVWIGNRLKSKHLWLAVFFAVVAHVLWLTYSIQQTLRGRDRWDMDIYGIFLFILTAISCMVTALMLIPNQPIDRPKASLEQ
jgi:hypothetical protein